MEPGNLAFMRVSGLLYMGFSLLGTWLRVSKKRNEVCTKPKDFGGYQVQDTCNVNRHISLWSFLHSQVSLLWLAMHEAFCP